MRGAALPVEELPHVLLAFPMSCGTLSMKKVLTLFLICTGVMHPNFSRKASHRGDHFAWNFTESWKVTYGG